MKFLIDLFVPHARNNYRAKTLHLSSLSVFLVIVMFGQLLLTAVNQTFPGVLGLTSSITADQLVELTNQERLANGLEPLSLNQDLVQAASLKGSDMIAKDYWAHTSPDGQTPWSFIKEVGYTYLYAGENLARDFTDSSSVVNAWMNSPTHRANILSSRYHDLGIAVIDGDFQGQETTLVVQMFGTEAAPAVAQNTTKPALIAQAQAETINASPTASAPAETTPSAVVIGDLAANNLEAPPTPSVLGKLIARLPGLSDFILTKSLSIALTVIILLAIVIDTFVITRQHIVRLAGKNLAHLIFLGVLLVLLLAIQPGLIL